MTPVEFLLLLETVSYWVLSLDQVSWFFPLFLLPSQAVVPAPVVPQGILLLLSRPGIHRIRRLLLPGRSAPRTKRDHKTTIWVLIRGQAEFPLANELYLLRLSVLLRKLCRRLANEQALAPSLKAANYVQRSQFLLISQGFQPWQHTRGQVLLSPSATYHSSITIIQGSI